MPDLFISRLICCAVNETAYDSEEVGVVRSFPSYSLIFRHPFVDLFLHSCEQVPIALINEVQIGSSKVSDCLPDMDRDRNHHATISRFEVGSLEPQVHVVIVEYFPVKMKVLSAGDSGLRRHLQVARYRGKDAQ